MSFTLVCFLSDLSLSQSLSLSLSLSSRSLVAWPLAGLVPDRWPLGDGWKLLAGWFGHWPLLTAMAFSDLETDERAMSRSAVAGPHLPWPPRRDWPTGQSPLKAALHSSGLLS